MLVKNLLSSVPEVWPGAESKTVGKAGDSSRSGSSIRTMKMMENQKEEGPGMKKPGPQTLAYRVMKKKISYSGMMISECLPKATKIFRNLTKTEWRAQWL